ncbi:MAG: UbiD family decarboxylase [Thermodesulfobacteriota bacterium]
MEYRDLRDFLSKVEAMGELKKVYGVDWDKEMGAITEILYRKKAEKSPLLLFDRIKGYPEGYQCLYGMLNSPKRFALSLGLPLPEEGGLMDTLKLYRERMKDMELIPPTYVKDGPVLENVLEGDRVDLFRFPVPIHHELDGGRYIGTADGVITRDPEEGWVNCGTYRVQLVDKNTCILYISQGKQGRIQRDKYLEKGKPCPVVVVVGIDPLLYIAARYQVPWGVSEFDFAGGLLGEPVEVIKGKYTDLPIPARAEIVLEGEVLPDQKLPEGPFGEWHGYYAGGRRDEPVLKIKRVMFRNHPILTCAASQKPPHSHLFERCFIRSAGLWDGLEKSGCPEVKGVWVHSAGSGRTFNVVAIKQRYYGHSRQAGMLASQIPPSAYIGRFVIVVDDDIDPSNLNEVIWAMGSRCDPAQDIEITRKCWGSRLDPMTVSDRYYNSRAVIDACIPYERINDFPPVARTTPEFRKVILEKYSVLMKELLSD